MGEGFEDSLLNNIVSVGVVSDLRLDSPPERLEMRLDQVLQQITSTSEDLTNDNSFFLFTSPYWHG